MNEQRPSSRSQPEHDIPPRDPAIYVASLSDYNAGRLHGSWIAANQEPEELQAMTDAMLAESPEPGAEEWAIHDYDNFGSIQIGEHSSFETVSYLAIGLSIYGPAFGAFARHCDNVEEATYEAFEQTYAGQYDSVEDYTDELIDRPSIENRFTEVAFGWIAPYISIDSAGLARDLQLGGDIEVVEDPHGVHIFTRRND